MNVPQLRFNGFSGEWVEVLLGEVTKLSGIKNKKNESYPTCSINNKNGFIPQDEQFENGRLSDLDKSLYIIVKSNEFAYNPARINVGSIGYQKYNYDVIVSSLYEVFKTEKNINDYFLNQFFQTKKFNDLIYKYSEGSVRMYLFYTNFKRIPLKLPTLPEQEKIADFLSTLDEKIQNQQDILDNLIKQKKGYTQKLFSQELRFDGFTDVWVEVLLGDVCKVNMGQSPKSDKYNTENIGIPLVQGNADIKDRKTLPQRYTSHTTKVADIGDIIMSVRAPVGSIAKSTIKVCIGRGVCSIKNNVKSIQEYIYQLLLSKENDWSKVAQGGTFTAINGDEIKGLSIQLPTLPEQEKIADFLSTFDEKIDNESLVLDNLLLLKKGLLQQLFC